MASSDRSKRVEFTVKGPFEIPLQSDRSRILDVKAFWRQSGPDALRARSGCYVFALEKPKRSVVPYYVGRTKRGFVDEVFNPSNLVKYQQAMELTRHRKPVLFIVIPPETGKKRGRRYIGEVETFLIQAGARRNPEIRNVKGKQRPKWFIRGVVGVAVGKPSRPARKLSAAMKLDRPK